MGRLARVALLLVPDGWRESVARDLREEATRVGRSGLARDLWISAHACRIAWRLRLRRATAIAHDRPGWRLGHLGSDLRHSVRLLRRQPWSNAAIALTLALGIAATTTVYAVFNHLLFRPMPGIRAQGELVTILFQPDDAPLGMAPGHRDAVAAFRGADVGLTSLAEWSGAPKPAPAVLQPNEEARLVSVEYVARDYLETLGVQPRVGRLFSTAETIERGHAVALVSEPLWRREFGGTTSVLGRTINIGGSSFAVVGVLDRYRGWGRTAANAVDIWLPEPAGRPASDAASRPFTLIARLSGAEPPESVEARIREVYAPLRATQEAVAARIGPRVYGGLRTGPRPLGFGLPPFSFVLGISSLLLVMACANAANLLLAMTTRRRQDLAMRAAVGASRWRLARALLVESGLLAAAAIGAGLGLTSLILRAIDGTSPFERASTLADVAIDGRVVLFASAAGAATVLMFALLPVLSASRVDLRAVLQETSRASTRSTRLSRGLVALQIGVSVILMAGAAVMVRSLTNLHGVDLGMDRGVFSFTFDPRLAGARGGAADRLLRTTVAGGGAGYVFASRLIASRLFGVTRLDPSTMAAVVALLALAIAIAAWLPARHAAAIDPVTALRE